MKFVVSFTTSPTRIHKCGQMINSILDQSRKPDLFLLNIPEEFARTGEKYDVPRYIRKSLTVNHIQVDYGPATKIIPTVAYLSHPDRADKYDPEDTRIIYLDDDDALNDENSLYDLSNEIQNEDQFIMWRVKFPNRLVPSNENFGNEILNLIDFESHKISFHWAQLRFFTKIISYLSI
jgi:hypothetical protein